MATPTLEGQIADALLAAVQKNQSNIVAAINGAEGGLAAFITNELNTVKIGNAFEQALFDVIKPTAVAELVAVESQYSGSVIFQWAMVKAAAWAKELGG
jgi:hypothetical protein